MKRILKKNVALTMTVSVSLSEQKLLKMKGFSLLK